MPEFVNQDLTGSEFRSCNFVDVTMRAIEFNRVTVRGSELIDVDIQAEIGRLVVNGVDVGPLVEAELDRRYPDRPRMRPTTPDGFRAAWDTVDLPWDDMEDTPAVPRDRAGRPSLDEALALRMGRMRTVREFVDNVDASGLASDTAPVDGPGWPPPRSFPVAECLRVVLNEEWEHRLYAERDLAVLESRSKSELA